MVRLICKCIFLTVFLISCQREPLGTQRLYEDKLTIGEYLLVNQDQYSKFYMVLDQGGLLSSLGAYNPNGTGYTLFLPTDEAVDLFIQDNPDYGNFEEMLLDTSLIDFLARYHSLNQRVHTYDFPHGALKEETHTGDRLIIGLNADGDDPLYKVNNEAPIIQSNMEMTNGFIHVISRVLHPVEISGYDWLQQQEHHSILAQAMELAGIRDRLWNQYTVLAEHDSIYQRKGIVNIDDLIERVASQETPLTDRENPFYQFAAFHILRGDIYLNDLDMGTSTFRTLADDRLEFNVGLEIRINAGVDTFGIEISESGDTSYIDYISLIWEEINIPTNTGPVHSISELLNVEPLQ